MNVFSKNFEGVVAGDIYPTSFKPGDTCPEELLAAARELGVLGDGRADPLESMKADELKKLLDDKQIQYKSNASRADLIALLKAAPAQ